MNTARVNGGKEDGEEGGRAGEEDEKGKIQKGRRMKEGKRE